MKKIYTVLRGGYDYFDHQGYYAPKIIYEGASLMEAWDAYKTSKKFDYHYNDSWMETQPPRMKWIVEIPKHQQHGIRVGHKPTTIEYLQAITAQKRAICHELQEKLDKSQYYARQSIREALNKTYDELFSIYHMIEELRNPPCDNEQCDDYLIFDTDQMGFDITNFDFGQ